MTDYYTRDGVKIEVGGIYLNSLGDKFECVGFRKHDKKYTVIGEDIYGNLASYNPTILTSIPESKKQYDPKEMWMVYSKNSNGQLYSNGYLYGSLVEAKKYSPNFAIAKFGQPFVEGENL